MPAVGLATETNVALSVGKLEIAPELSGYMLTDGASHELRDARGGTPRVRRDKNGSVAVCDVQWILDATDYAALSKFHEDYFHLTFRMDLFADQFTLTEHYVRFVPETFSLTQQTGNAYYVVAQLEVQLIPPNAAYDGGLIAIYGSYQENSNALMNALAIFANQTVEQYL